MCGYSARSVFLISRSCAGRLMNGTFRARPIEEHRSDAPTRIVMSEERMDYLRVSGAAWCKIATALRRAWKPSISLSPRVFRSLRTVGLGFQGQPILLPRCAPGVVATLGDPPLVHSGAHS